MRLQGPNVAITPDYKINFHGAYPLGWRLDS